jgi:hypothetical protein
MGDLCSEFYVQMLLKFSKNKYADHTAVLLHQRLPVFLEHLRRLVHKFRTTSKYLGSSAHDRASPTYGTSQFSFGLDIGIFCDSLHSFLLLHERDFGG